MRIKMSIFYDPVILLESIPRNNLKCEQTYAQTANKASFIYEHKILKIT